MPVAHPSVVRPARRRANPPMRLQQSSSGRAAIAAPPESRRPNRGGVPRRGPHRRARSETRPTRSAGRCGCRHMAPRGLSARTASPKPTMPVDASHRRSCAAVRPTPRAATVSPVAPDRLGMTCAASRAVVAKVKATHVIPAAWITAPVSSVRAAKRPAATATPISVADPTRAARQRTTRSAIRRRPARSRSHRPPSSSPRVIRVAASMIHPLANTETGVPMRHTVKPPGSSRATGGPDKILTAGFSASARIPDSSSKPPIIWYWLATNADIPPQIKATTTAPQRS